jgi:hypothetical protein
LTGSRYGYIDKELSITIKQGSLKMSTNSELKELMRLFITQRYKFAHYLTVASLVKKTHESPPETLPELLYQLMLSKDPNMLDGMKKKA